MLPGYFSESARQAFFRGLFFFTPLVVASSRPTWHGKKKRQRAIPPSIRMITLADASLASSPGSKRRNKGHPCFSLAQWGPTASEPCLRCPACTRNLEAIGSAGQAWPFPPSHAGGYQRDLAFGAVCSRGQAAL
ncbi:hypothetical protein BJ166DRAFT_327406 [Pestalotiopsis sp. NC0098]|nr:hypothetical protein BJ166DRAFT_327406 [Pestalotiopsis sp. NC0098]